MWTTRSSPGWVPANERRTLAPVDRRSSKAPSDCTTDPPRSTLDGFISGRRSVGSRHAVRTTEPVQLRPGGSSVEAYVSTQQPSPGQAPRLSSSHVDPRRSRDLEEPPPQGPAAVVGLIGRISERSAFDRLRVEGRRRRAGDLWVISVHDANMTSPHVAFAIGRTAGSSVVRHRIRRRLRAAMHELDQQGAVRPGLYLIGAGTSLATCEYHHVLRDLSRAIITESGK